MMLRVVIVAAHRDSAQVSSEMLTPQRLGRVGAATPPCAPLRADSNSAVYLPRPQSVATLPRAPRATCTILTTPNLTQSYDSGAIRCRRALDSHAAPRPPHPEWLASRALACFHEPARAVPRDPNHAIITALRATTPVPHLSPAQSALPRAPRPAPRTSGRSSLFGLAWPE